MNTPKEPADETTEVVRMNINEFREKGYLQEINRRFLHPLGLALEVVQISDGVEKLGGIWDYRNDKEGMHYDIGKETDKERIKRFKERKKFIDNEFETRSKERVGRLGFEIEPID